MLSFVVGHRFPPRADDGDDGDSIPTTTTAADVGARDPCLRTETVSTRARAANTLMPFNRPSRVKVPSSFVVFSLLYRDPRRILQY